MKFFVPAAKDNEQAEEVYKAVAKFVGGNVSDNRIWKLRWKHNRMDMEAKVGKPLPPYYRTGQEPVIAIIDCRSYYSVCTPSRGTVGGGPFLVGKGDDPHVTFFDTEQ